MKRVQTYILTAVFTLIVALSLAPTAFAAIYNYPVQGGNLKFDPTTGTITDCDTSVYAADIPSTIYGVEVTKIGNNAFSGCSKLTSVTIPSTVTSIGYNAFSYCSRLTSISIPESVKTFEVGSQSRKSGTFYNCTSLEKVTIPGSIKVLPSGTFEGCTNLKKVSLKSGIEKIGSFSSYGVFIRCNNLESIWLPDSVVEVVKLAEYCSSLSVVTMGRSVKYIADNSITKCPVGSIFFLGNAPVAGPKLAGGNAVKIYYSPGTTGWTPPTWNGFILLTHALIKLDANGGTVSSSTWVTTTDGTFDFLPTPTRPNYTFVGWYTAETGGTKVTSDTAVTGDITLYAHWTSTIKTYTITLNANGGTVSSTSVKVESGKTYLSQLPTPTRNGYTFAGWYTAKTGGTKITSTTKATANRTIYAHWTEKEEDTTGTVKFNGNGGTVFQRYKAVLRGARYRDLPTPTRPGYHFLGWYTKPTGGTKVTSTTRVTIAGDHTLYARWTKTAPKVQSTRTGSWTVYIPPYYKLPLYTTQTTAVQSKVNPASAREYAVTCTKMATLSNGTVRYYGRVNGVNRWFQFTSEMDVA